MHLIFLFLQYLSKYKRMEGEMAWPQYQNKTNFFKKLLTIKGISRKSVGQLPRTMKVMGLFSVSSL